MRDIHKVGWVMVSVLRLQTQDKAKESQVQGKAQGQNQRRVRGTTGPRAYSAKEIVIPLGRH